MIIPIRNLYYLLLYAWRHFDALDTTVVSSSDHDHIANLLSRLLLVSVPPLLRRGLRRDYVAEVQEDSGIRGRLLLRPTIRHNLLARGRAVCESDTLTVDRLENRLLKAAVATLMRAPETDRELRAELRLVYGHLQGIAEVPLTTQGFRTVQLYRADRGYVLPLRVSWLLSKLAFPEPSTGQWRVQELRRDEREMALLFQEFIRRFLAREQAHSRVSADQIGWYQATGAAESLGLLPIMKTDVVLSRPDRKLVIEVKYTARLFQEQYAQRASFESPIPTPCVPDQHHSGDIGPADRGTPALSAGR